MWVLGLPSLKKEKILVLEIGTVYILKFSATSSIVFHVLMCHWWRFRDMIATGCEDKNVRVYYVATSSDQPLKVFSGHTAKVFHVKWSPLSEGVLCSGSDDGYVFLDFNFLVFKIISL